MHPQIFVVAPLVALIWALTFASIGPLHTIVGSGIYVGNKSARSTLAIPYAAIEERLKSRVLSEPFKEAIQAAAKQENGKNKIRAIGWGGLFPAAIRPDDPSRGVLVALVTVDLLWDTRGDFIRDHGALFTVAIPIHLTLDAGQFRAAAGRPQLADIHSWGGGGVGIGKLKDESRVRTGVANAVAGDKMRSIAADSIAGAGLKDILPAHNGTPPPIHRLRLTDTACEIDFGSPGDGPAFFDITDRQKLFKQSRTHFRSFVSDVDAVFVVTLFEQNQVLLATETREENGDIDWSLLDNNKGRDQQRKEREVPGTNQITLVMGSSFDCESKEGGDGHLDNRLLRDDEGHRRPNGQKWKNRASVVLVERGPAWNGQTLHVSQEKNKGGFNAKLHLGFNMLEIDPPFGGKINRNVIDMWVEAP